MASLPVHLPTLQNWSCHNCGGCCRQHAITITPEEKSRIEAQNWTPADGIPASQPLFVEEGSWLQGQQIRLSHQADGACVFLNEQGLCRIHAKFGESAKPLACRIYPYAFHPLEKQLTVSLRFSCPSVAANRGKSLTSQKQDLRQLAQLVVPESYHGAPPPLLKPQTRLNWEDTVHIVESLDRTLSDAETPVAVKLTRALFWLELIAQSKFTKIQGERLEELLELLLDASQVEVPDLKVIPPAPTRMGMTQFRLLTGLYARKDTASSIDTSLQGRWRQLKHAIRLARGTGMLPALHTGLLEIPFSALDQVRCELTAASEEMLTRYFRVKIQGMHFCGAAYYHVPVIEGFQALTLTYPVVRWISRWLAASASRISVTHEDILTALTIVDHQHAYNPALGQWPARRRVRNFVANGDLQKLIARI